MYHSLSWTVALVVAWLAMFLKLENMEQATSLSWYWIGSDHNQNLSIGKSDHMPQFPQESMKQTTMIRVIIYLPNHITPTILLRAWWRQSGGHDRTTPWSSYVLLSPTWASSRERGAFAESAVDNRRNTLGGNQIGWTEGGTYVLTLAEMMAFTHT